MKIHTDPDHIDAFHLFNNAKVYMHEDEEQMINGKACKFLLAGFTTPDVFNKMNYKILITKQKEKNN
jgi:hypothetical protein